MKLSKASISGNNTNISIDRNYQAKTFSLISAVEYFFKSSKVFFTRKFYFNSLNNSIHTKLKSQHRVF